ncbi:MAG: glycosyltransferase, partial [Diaphorobacter sp.]|nr:glycosyltransferase [Diaphorobacter sp.]
LLAQAFVRACELAPQLRSQLRLVLVGEGPLRAVAHQLLVQAGCLELAWLSGARNDVADILRGLHGFVLPSLSEGISNTILEAMASGLPVIATDVGGNAELVAAHETGYLCASGDVEAMAQLIVRLASDPAQAQRLGQAGRARVEQQFSLSAMVAAYQQLYDQLLGQARRVAR